MLPVWAKRPSRRSAKLSKRVVLVGLGATGLAMARSFARRTDIQIVGAADQNPAHIGADLGTLIDSDRVDVTVVGNYDDLPAADLAIVATTSDLNQVASTLLPLIEQSYNVLSICEELSYPWSSHPEISRKLDEIARAHGVTVVGSGANPGVLMDTLPLLLSVLTQDVTRVTIRRRTNMSRYGAILSKFGLGLTTDGFATAQGEGSVIGHCGFEQAIGALAAGLGWDLDAIEVDKVVPAVVAKDTLVGEHITIQSGQVCAVTHAARGIRHGATVIDLAITFGFFGPGGDVTAGDDYLIEGTDQSIELSSASGFESFLSTIAAAVNTAAAVVEAEPGFLSMGDLAARAIASKGERLLSEGSR